MRAETADDTAWVLGQARRLASEVLGPSAVTVEASHRMPVGSTAIRLDHDAHRLAREALFLLVFGSRPAIKQSLSSLLIGPAADRAGR
jgi:hypothetical protein